MKTAAIYKLSILIAWTLILFSCAKQENNILTNSKEIIVGLQITPTIEQDSRPLSRASITEDGIYAVNVFWKKGSSYLPYATGLFDNINNISIGLIEGYLYRFDCTFLNINELYSRDREVYGLPFSITPNKEIDATVTNKLTISINPLNENTMFHQHIYKGATHIKADSISERPANTYRFYGSNTIDLTTAAPIADNNRPIATISIELKRAYYTLQFAAENLSEGDSIRVETTNAKPFIIINNNSSNKPPCSEERLLSLANIVSNPSWGGNINEQETLPINIYYRPKDATEWTWIIKNQSITAKRNIRNLVTIRNIDQHYKGQTSISFEGNNSDFNPSDQEEQTIE